MGKIREKAKMLDGFILLINSNFNLWKEGWITSQEYKNYTVKEVNNLEKLYNLKFKKKLTFDEYYNGFVELIELRKEEIDAFL